MAQLQITIDLGNAAFEGASRPGEVARILGIISKRFLTDRDNKWRNVHDINGNPVGKFKVDTDAEPSFN